MQERPENDGVTFRQTVNVVYFFLSSYATCLLVFTRHGFGQEALGMNGIGAMIWLFLYGGCFVHGDILFWHFVLAWFIALVVQRFITGIGWWRGRSVHSQFTGHAWLVKRLFPRVTQESACPFIEAAICAGVGLLLLLTSQSLGNFIVWGALAIVLKSLFEQQAMRARLQAMRDAEIETRYFHDVYRGRRNEF